MRKDELILIAIGLDALKRVTLKDIRSKKMAEVRDYLKIQLSDIEALAEKLRLDSDYFSYSRKIGS